MLWPHVSCLVAASFLLATGCTHPPVSGRATASPPQNSAIEDAIGGCRAALGRTDGMVREGTTLCFSGEVPTGAQVAIFVEEVARSDLLVVRSQGGRVNEALAVGRAIAARRMTVAVWDYCTSSCANYWLLGAHWKYVGPGAAIGYHGGPPAIRSCRGAEIPEDCRALRRTYRDSNAFLRAQGIDPAILYSPPADYDLTQRETVMWVPSRSELTGR
jgi:hypothetical protein